LDAFYIVTNIFSGSNYYTANVFFFFRKGEFYHILCLLREISKNEGTLLGRMAKNMLVKFEKYWVEKEPNLLLFIALISDPKFKLEYLKFGYNRIYTNSLVTIIIDPVERELHAFFSEYLKMHESACCKDEDIEKEKVTTIEGSSCDASFKNMEFKEEFCKFSEEENMSHSKSELDIYLEEKLHPQKHGSEDNVFEMLDYWKINATKFPVVSIVARDLLAIPVSSVASESTFSTEG
jgi:hypothetical protein